MTGWFIVIVFFYICAPLGLRASSHAWVLQCSRFLSHSPPDVALCSVLFVLVGRPSCSFVFMLVVFSLRMYQVCCTSTRSWTPIDTGSQKAITVEGDGLGTQQTPGAMGHRSHRLAPPEQSIL